MRPSWDGYRVLVTTPAGARGGGPGASPAWVNLDRAGADAFLRDHSGGGSEGGIWTPKRLGADLGSPALYGYNQASTR